MRVPLSSSLKSELLTLLLFLHPLVFLGSTGRQVWGIPVQELKETLSRAEYSSLSGVDVRSKNLSEAFSLGPEAPYCLSIVFRKLGRPDTAEAFLELAWERSARPWKEEAGLELADLSLRDKDYSRTKQICGALLSMRNRASPVARSSLEERARRLLVEALYWNGEDERTLEEAARLPSTDAEVDLFKAVASLRLKRKAARGLFVDLFLSRRACPVHARAWLYLRDDEEALKVFSEDERRLMEAKYAFGRGDWSTGVPLMEEAVSGMDPERLSGSTVISELGAAYLSGGMASRGAVFMNELRGGLRGQALLDAMEAAGRCSRSLRDYRGAIRSFRALEALAGDPSRRDRARWLALEALLNADPPDLAGEVGRESARWEDASVFSDLLEDRIAGLVAARKWKDLGLLYSGLGERAPAPIAAELSYILARALQEKLIAPDADTPAGGAEELLRTAEDRDPQGYYGALAACLLEEPARRFQTAVSPRELLDAPPREDPLVQGYLSFGLSREAFDAVWEARDGLADGQISAYAKALDRAGDYRSAMNLAGYLSGRRPLTSEETRILFPLAYRVFMEEAAGICGFPGHLFYGLIREESYFDPEIVSGAGATGLAQLMPDTAADAARGLRLREPDLSDPETNLELGAFHLGKLLSRVGSIPKALLSYNAGLSRIRLWDRNYGDLPADLYVEAVPYRESRRYVRKILVSSLMYASLYGEGDPWQTVRLFYPGLPGGAGR